MAPEIRLTGCGSCRVAIDIEMDWSADVDRLFVEVAAENELLAMDLRPCSDSPRPRSRQPLRAWMIPTRNDAERREAASFCLAKKHLLAGPPARARSYHERGRILLEQFVVEL